MPMTIDRMTICVGLVLLVSSPALAGDPPLLVARKGFETKILTKVRQGPETALPDPQTSFLRRVVYDGPAGKLSAWLSTAPENSKDRRPAIVWVAGGWPAGGMDESAWQIAPAENDQSAKAYREAGMIIMYPTFRGSYGNDGYQELYYGEVDDLLAAIDYVAKLPYVDPERIYLGGHSAGATLVLLGAAAGPRVRGVIALGPATIETMYSSSMRGAGGPLFDDERTDELRLRDPFRFASVIEIPTIIIEGARSVPDLRVLERARENPNVAVHVVPHTDHFTVIAPVNLLLAKRISTGRFEVTQEELDHLGEAQERALQASEDYLAIGRALRYGAPLDTPSTARFYIYYWNDRDGVLRGLAKRAREMGFVASDVVEEPRGSSELSLLSLEASVRLEDLEAVRAVAARARSLAREAKAGYDGWEVLN